MLSEKQSKIATAIIDVNLLLPQPLDASQLEDWAVLIDKIVPGVEISELETIMRNYAIGFYEWDHRKGIQNVLSKIEAVKMEIHKRTMVY